MKRICFLLTIITFFFIGESNCFAQDSSGASKKWKFLVEPYFMFAGMNGTVGVGNLPDVNVDASFGDILNNLKFGMMAYAEAYSDKWAITTDIIYMKLGQNATPSTIINKGEVALEQFIWELAGLRKLSPMVDVGIGARIVSLNTNVDLVQNNIGGGTTARNKSITETWIDPLIIARMKIPTKGKLNFHLRSDIGGFGIGSDFTWHIQANVGYRFSKLFQMSAGYRVFDINYENGSNENRFLYDMSTTGPELRFRFNL